MLDDFEILLFGRPMRQLSHLPVADAILFRILL